VNAQELSDRAALEDLVARLAYAQDDRDYSAFGALFTDVVLLDMFGVPSSEVAADDLTAKAASTLGAWAYTQHSTCNVLVELGGDRAAVRANGTTYLHAPTEPGVADYCLTREYLNLGCVRTDDGWLIDRVTIVRDAPAQGYYGLYTAAHRREDADA
jgi:3-phenylpropionate/cinnamic acid dioxygenase small subunit